MANIVLHTEHLCIGYDKSPLMPEINVSLSEGDVVALAGQNGAGKTTLFKTLCCSIRPISGKIFCLGNDITSYSATERASLFSLVLTEKPDDLFLKVFDIVAAGRYPQLGLLARLSQTDKDFIDNSLDTIGISHLKDRNFISLSDGEKQKVMIAKAIVQDTPIIFMDEPTAFLDYPSKIELTKLMLKLAKEHKKTILFSSHDLDLLLRYSDKMWIIGPGLPLVEGSPRLLAEQGLIDEYFKPIVAKQEFPFL